MDKFIGCLVSLNCGESLGVFQGKVDSINTGNNTLTITNTFRNGTPHKVSKLTLRSQDITELKIIKDAEVINEIPTNYHFNPTTKTNPPTTHNLPNIQTIPPTTHNLPNIQTLPLLPFYHSPHKSHSSHSIKTPNKNKFHNPSPKHQSHLSKEHSYTNFQFPSVPISNSYNFDNHYHHNNHLHHPLDNHNNHHENHSFDNHHNKISLDNHHNNHPLDNHHNNHPLNNHQNNNHHDKNIKKNKVIALFGEHSNPSFKKTKPFSRQHRNSECFKLCEGDFDEEFDFESNLALFDKITTLKNNPKPISNSHQNKQPQNIITESSITPDRDLKYKCDENVIKGVEWSCRQIFFIHQPTNYKYPITFPFADTTPKHSTSTHHHYTVMGEYKTDAGFILPGVDEVTRDQLLQTVFSSAFSASRLIQSYGRSISEAVMQYLGGSARFEPKNAHQRPSVTIIVSTTNPAWVCATALNVGRVLANRSATVKLYMMPSSSSPHLLSSALFQDEFHLFLATSTGSVVNNFKDLKLEDGLDLIISTLHCKAENYNINNNDSINTNTKNNHDSINKNLSNNKNLNNKNLIHISNKILNKNLNNNNNSHNVETTTILRKLSKLTNPTFAIEPCTSSPSPLPFKRSFVCAIPLYLPHSSYGQVCYCDVGIPDKLYSKAGVAYKSPFFDKFFLTLVPQSSADNNTNKN